MGQAIPTPPQVAAGEVKDVQLKGEMDEVEKVTKEKVGVVQKIQENVRQDDEVVDEHHNVPPLYETVTRQVRRDVRHEQVPNPYSQDYHKIGHGAVM